MSRNEAGDGGRKGNDPAAIDTDLHFAAKHRPRRRGAKRDDRRRPDRLDLPLQPLAAGVDLDHGRLLVQPPFAADDELEVFDRVGDIGALALDSRIPQRPVKQHARRSDEGLTGKVLLVARLFADEHEARVRRSLAEHNLARVLPQRARAADRRTFFQPCERCLSLEVCHQPADSGPPLNGPMMASVIQPP